jgi:hypothetical protein
MISQEARNAPLQPLDESKLVNVDYRDEQPYQPGDIERSFEDTAKALSKQLVDLKYVHNTPMVATSNLLQVLKTELKDNCPELAALLPNTFDACFRETMGAPCDFERIPCCKNDCCVFDFELKESDVCPKCEEPKLDEHGKPHKEFRVICFNDKVANWFANPILAEALKYPTERDTMDIASSPDELMDVQDGTLWRDRVAEELQTKNANGTHTHTHTHTHAR